MAEDETNWQQLMATMAYLTKFGKVEEKDMQQALNEARVSKRKAAEFKRTYTDLDDWFNHGRKKGRVEAALKIVMQLLERRFGALSITWQSRLKRLSPKQLEQLSVALLDFTSRRDVSAWLKEHAN